MRNRYWMAVICAVAIVLCAVATMNAQKEGRRWR